MALRIEIDVMADGCVLHEDADQIIGDYVHSEFFLKHCRG
jgi:hypothetical protein